MNRAKTRVSPTRPLLSNDRQRRYELAGLSQQWGQDEIKSEHAVIAERQALLALYRASE